jgi:hypothetical protein
MRLASLLTILIASASITVLSACSSTNAVPNPPVFAHLYVTDGSGNVDVYRLPLTAASTPTLTFAAGGCAYCGLAVSQHKLYVGAGSTVKVYQLPLTASSTSIQTLTASASTTLSIAADSSGTIYVAENSSGTCCVDVFQGGASTPTFTLSGASVASPYGVAIDSAGNAFVANASSIGYFAATVHSGEAGITFGRDDFNEGLVTDSADNLYVADGDGQGTMDVYHPAYTGASAPASTVTLTAGYLEQMAMSTNGTMYIANESPNQIDVLTSPYTANSVTVPTSFQPYGIAVGP